MLRLGRRPLDVLIADFRKELGKDEWMFIQVRVSASQVTNPFLLRTRPHRSFSDRSNTSNKRLLRDSHHHVLQLEWFPHQPPSAFYHRSRTLKNKKFPFSRFTFPKHLHSANLKQPTYGPTLGHRSMHGALRKNVLYPTFVHPEALAIVDLVLSG